MASDWNPEETIQVRRRREAVISAVEAYRHSAAMLGISMDEASLALRRFYETWKECEQLERYRTAKTYGLI